MDNVTSDGAALHGVLAILVTPFHDDGRFDEASFRRQIDFAIARGATGVISTAIFGEFFTLSDNERRTIAEVMVDQTRRRVPAIATTSGLSAQHAAELTRHASEIGVDAVMAMPPYVAKLSPTGVYEYFRALDEVAACPIIIQNAAHQVGSPVAPDDIARMLRDLERCRYVKEEVPPNPTSMQATAEAVNGLALGLFGGFGGLYMVTEYRRGCTGWMVAPEFIEAPVEIYRSLAASDEAGARALHARLLPALVYEHLLGIPWAKRALQIRGVIASSHARVPAPALLPEDLHELRVILDDLAPFLIDDPAWPS